MVGVIWYRFVRCGGTDWSDTVVPIHPLQWYRFADIITYSLTQSCKLCNVNPYDYWEDLLTNSCNPTRTIDSFMPHLWRKQP